MIIYSDLHLDDYPEFTSPWKWGCGTRLKAGLDVLARIFEIADELDDPNVVDLGDLMHKWRATTTPVQAIITDHVYALLERYSSIHLHRIPGNHDLYDKRNPACHTLKAFHYHPRIHVYDKPEQVNVGGFLCTVIPYYDDPEYVASVMLTLAESDVLLAHVDVVGAKTSIENYESKYGINMERLFEVRAYGLGIFGHYHLRQQLNPIRDGHFQYVGSPMQLGWINTGEQHGILHVTRDGHIPRFISLDDAPKFVRLRWDASPGRRPTIENCREQDYHEISCPANCTDIVEEEFSSLKYLRVVPDPCQKETGLSNLRQPSKYSEASDAMRVYMEQRVGKVCELELESLLHYGGYYLP